jgi:SAM-dependent methyltransferase
VGQFDSWLADTVTVSGDPEGCAVSDNVLTLPLYYALGPMTQRRSGFRRFLSWGKRHASRIQLAISTPRLSFDRSEWTNRAQPGELAWHQTDQWRRSDDFMVDSARLFEHFGFAPNDFAGRVVLDLGAGSRLRTRYFEGARIVAVEPLAEQFRVLDFSDLDTAYEVHATPAEEFLPQWEGKVDLLVSINVLDHCYAFAPIVANVRRYLAPSGQALLSFDVHPHSDSLHPLIIKPKTCRAAFRQNALRVTHESKGFGDLGYRWYGHPPYAVTFIVRPSP